MLRLAAVGAALLLPEPDAAFPDHLRPGAGSQDRLSAPAALAVPVPAMAARGLWLAAAEAEAVLTLAPDEVQTIEDGLAGWGDVTLLRFAREAVEAALTALGAQAS